jgi:cobalt-zinc-cadmium efflux system membrane fusion protein
MSLRRPATLKPIALTVLGLAVAIALTAGVLFGLPLLRAWTQPANANEERVSAPVDSGVNVVPGATDSLRVLPKVKDKLKIEVKPVADARPRLLELRGYLTFDPQKIARTRSRFQGEVDRITEVRDDQASMDKGQSVTRPLRPGDLVKKGDLLAVVWSKDLGEKKSELVNALSQLYLDQTTLKEIEEGVRKGVIPEQRAREQRQQVESDLIAVDKARRTLESWRLTDEEIKTIEDEAHRIRERQGQRDPQKRKDWPRVDIVSPISGVIAEKNVVKGDYVADMSADLFKIANIDQLTVWANLYEEDLPALQAYEKELNGKAIPWKIRLRDNTGFVPVEGRVTRIGLIVDPVQHSIIVEGTVENKDFRLRAGENITATITLPPAQGEVSIPIGALVEDGKESIVFKVTGNNQFTMVPVQVTRRGLDEAQIKTGPVQKGDHVVSSGAIELKAALEELQSKAQEHK